MNQLARRDLLPLLLRPRLKCPTAAAAMFSSTGLGLGLGHGSYSYTASPYIGVVSRGYSSTPSVCMDSGASSWNTDTYKDFGQNVFRGEVSKPYLTKYGLDGDVLERSDWAKDKKTADMVAKAVLDWARERGGFSYCHWFQPLGASYVRHGLSGQVQNSFVNFDNAGKAVWEFKGKQLLQGETDGSSFPNGGIRATHSSGAYVAIDPTSPIFLRGDTVFIPACITSFNGESLDEKTPLLRSADTLSREGSRLLNHLGYKVSGVNANIGLEQEFFLVPRAAYKKRPDLTLAGRTLLGRLGPRGQEMNDHYMAPLSFHSPALACMREIQDTCYKIGIPLRTRHREVAPNQFEFAPMYGDVTSQIDQNLNVMQIVEEIAAAHNLAAIFCEKPFQGINGSGKHNNWSLATNNGTNLLNVSDVYEDSKSDLVFPVVMAAMVKAVDKYGDLMRLSIATPGNDFRLGACEAPPAILTMYLGADMTKFLNDFKSGDSSNYVPGTKKSNFGASALPIIDIPAEDRNRTSPFTFGGHRFEFRAVGSSQNVSLTNTVLATITAQVFSEFSAAIEKGTSPKQVAQEALKKHWKVIFNGNGYDADNQKILTSKGVCRIDSGVDAISVFTDKKNLKLFSSNGVLSETECRARQEVLFSQYIGIVEIEANCLIDMVQMQIIPLLKNLGLEFENNAHEVEVLTKHVQILKEALEEIHVKKEVSLHASATLARTLRLEQMIQIREVIDKIEGNVNPAKWPFPSYKDLLFLDHI